MTYHHKRGARSDVDERRRAGEHRPDHHARGNRDLEAGKLVVEQNPGRADRMNGEEAARREEGERKQENARVTPPIGGSSANSATTCVG